MERQNQQIVIIGYGGHSLVIYDIIRSRGYIIDGYFDNLEHNSNPLKLSYLGRDEKVKDYLQLNTEAKVVVAIGNNIIREKLYNLLLEYSSESRLPLILDPSAIISSSSSLGFGMHIMPNVVINALSKLGNGVICNSGSIVEHECVIGDYTHLGPGSVLTGGCEIGRRCLIGANSVVRPMVKICDDVTIGAGSVVIKNIDKPGVYVGNPVKFLKHE
jgi:sugar O-acyltransferase (sialic acid O-acetyltransferase NeuD family)